MLKTKQEQERGYSDSTHELIEKIKRINLMPYRLKKEEISVKLKELYDFLEIECPEIVSCCDITDNEFILASWASRASQASRASWASRASRASMDYDLGYLVYCHEFLQHEKGNEHDTKALAIYMRFLELKELGLGYMTEGDGKLYCVPNPIISLDRDDRYHSTEKPAIYWENGLKCFFIHGVKFEENLWKQITEKELTAKEVLSITNTEQRYAALSVYTPEEILKSLEAKLISEGKPRKYYNSEETWKNELYEIEGEMLGLKGRKIKLLKYPDPSTKRVYVKYVPDKFEDADEAQAQSGSTTKYEYEIMEMEA